MISGFEIEPTAPCPSPQEGEPAAAWFRGYEDLPGGFGIVPVAIHSGWRVHHE